MIFRQLMAGAAAICLAWGTQAARVVDVHEVSDEGVGKKIGTVEITESEYGLVFSPALDGLQTGLHGFHVHEHASCGPAKKEGKRKAGIAAGGHYDPERVGHHGTPWGDGHLGDLPALFVNARGIANHPVLAPRLQMSDLEGRALMIHAGGDNYADSPEPLGGGGPRVACGVIE